MSNTLEKDNLFETMRPAKALAVMAVPTVASQVIILIYNLADTWFIGRTGNPYMIGASSLVLTIYLAETALANLFGVGGGSLMARLIGEKKTDDARRVASYSVAAAAIAALAFSVLLLVFAGPLLRLLGASDNTFVFARQYLIVTAVIGGIPTVMSMSMPQLLRNAGYAKEAGIGVGLGSLMNVFLDPLFMFVILPNGYEVLGAGIATMLSNIISMVYFIVMFRIVKDKTVLELPRRIERIGRAHTRSLYSVGIPAALSIFFFDLVTMVINWLAASYGDIPLAAMGIVLKLERLPLNIGLGVLLGMVPLIAYNYGSGNYRRMRQFFSLARIVILAFSVLCVILFWFFADPLVGLFISGGKSAELAGETVRLGGEFLRGRCFALPFMMIGYHIVNYMNAIGKGKVSFLMAVIRHLVLIIPIMLVMNHVFGMAGFIWSQLVADLINTVIAVWVYRGVNRSVISGTRRAGRQDE